MIFEVVSAKEYGILAQTKAEFVDVQVSKNKLIIRPYMSQTISKRRCSPYTIGFGRVLSLGSNQSRSSLLGRHFVNPLAGGDRASSTHQP